MWDIDLIISNRGPSFANCSQSHRRFWHIGRPKITFLAGYPPGEITVEIIMPPPCLRRLFYANATTLIGTSRRQVGKRIPYNVVSSLSSREAFDIQAVSCSRYGLLSSLCDTNVTGGHPTRPTTCAPARSDTSSRDVIRTHRSRSPSQRIHNLIRMAAPSQRTSHALYSTRHGLLSSLGVRP